MINRNEFQSYARKFRGGRISLSEFTSAVLGDSRRADHVSEDSESTPEFQFPKRPVDAHKGDFGRLMMVGGSATMPGAIALSAMAALRSGAGLVTVLTPAAAHAVVAGFSPCLMTTGMVSKDGVFSSEVEAEILDKCERADVVAIGPGMGRFTAGQTIVGRVYRECVNPVVVDADAINNLADAKLQLDQHSGPRIITPHPGEFSRISGTATNRREQLEEQAVAMAAASGIVVVLKGHRTLVTDGERCYRNSSGNSGMATAGSGDVLTGIIAALMGQRINAFEAAKTGCYIHGMAGNIYADQKDAATLIATDLIDYLPLAISAIKKG